MANGADWFDHWRHFIFQNSFCPHFIETHFAHNRHEKGEAECIFILQLKILFFDGYHDFFRGDDSKKWYFPFK